MASLPLTLPPQTMKSPQIKFRKPHSKFSNKKKFATTQFFFLTTLSFHRDESTLHLKPSTSKSSLSTAVVAAPAVAPNETMDGRRHVAPDCKEVSYNPKYEEMFAPMVGPENPHKTETQKADKNTLSGKVEPAHLNEFQFELQRRTFHSYGFAQDPSNDPSQELIGSAEGAEAQEHKSVFEGRNFWVG